MAALTFGIDLGIGSCGWAVVRHPERDGETGAIEAMGSWMFDVPETDKERTPTNQVRRGNRLLRRVLRRRRNRMRDLRQLFVAQMLIADADPEVLRQVVHEPWELRARGLDQALAPKEFAVALAHIAKRRGFKSAAKRKEGNTVTDDRKMLKALEATKERLGRYRTLGEMYSRDPDFVARRRNREGVYDRTASRDDLAHEVGTLFAAQRRLGQSFADEDFERKFKAVAFFQRPLQDSERLVGTCGLEPGEKRSAKFAPSFERFRLLQRLVHLRVMDGEIERALSPDELAVATRDLGRTAKLAAKAVRKIIGLRDDQCFATIRPEQEDQDIAARAGEALHGTKKLREALGEVTWAALVPSPDILDDIAQIISFHETNSTIIGKLKALTLPPSALDALTEALERGTFSRFKGAGHISAKAARAIIPHMQTGKRYDQACEAAGYDHAASATSGKLQVADKASFNALTKEVGEGVANPIARKAMTEGLKQLWAMRNKWGLPDAIHIELARDVGNSIEERRKIEKRLSDTTAQRARERKEARELLELDDVSGDTLLRYRLWKEQGGKCVYTGRAITPAAIAATDNSVQVDHILPWSRFGDDSYNNKTLCLASANQNKCGQTPFEWLGRSSEWDTFVERVETNRELRGFKKRNYLLKNAKDAEEQFRSRNLNDTRYAARLLAEAVKSFYPEGERQDRGGVRRVYTRPGALTSALRRGWGLEALKKVNGQRLFDDRHHALDALVVATVGEPEVQRLTRVIQESERQGHGRSLRYVNPPWPGFRTDVIAAYERVFVARPERRRARGEGHAATVRQVKQRNGQNVVFERRPIESLGLPDLARVKDAERNGRMVEAIRQWIERGKPTDEKPRSPTGHEITKVRLVAKGKPAVPVRGGTADRGEMVRVDVFAKSNRKGKDEFYLVPIYPHQVFDKANWQQPPGRSVIAYKEEAEWTVIDGSHNFKFSIYPRSYIEAVKSTGEILAGYLCSMDRSTGAISLFRDRSSKDIIRSIGAKTLHSLRKFSVDRFGNLGEIKSEVRTWHGVACTSLIPAS